MKFLPAGLFLIGFGILLGSENALACTVGRTTTGIGIPMAVVANAEVILRVTALRYALAPPDPRTRTGGVPDSMVQFHVEERSRGKRFHGALTIRTGFLSFQAIRFEKSASVT